MYSDLLMIRSFLRFQKFLPISNSFILRQRFLIPGCINKFNGPQKQLFAFKETAPRKEVIAGTYKTGESYEVLKTQGRTCQWFINGLLEARKFHYTTLKGKCPNLRS